MSGLVASGLFLDALAGYVVSSGFGQWYNSAVTDQDTVIQVDFRRDTIAHTILFRETGGAAYAHATKQLHHIQCLVDGGTLSGVKAKARAIHDFLHETLASTISGFQVLWLRAITQPQFIGELPDRPGRYVVAVNFQALLVFPETKTVISN